MPETDHVPAAVRDLLRPLLTALDALAYAGRHLHPPDLPALVDAVRPYREPLEAELTTFRAGDWPDEFRPLRDQLDLVATAALEAHDGLAASVGAENAVLEAYRAMRANVRAIEALYPLASALPPVSQFFVDDAHRPDDALLDRLARAGAGGDNTGVIHARNARDDRGGFSLYVPEYYDAETAWPLVVALHGGSGHGRDFLWTWLPAGRSAGALVLSPTSRDRTWSLHNPPVDAANLTAMITHVADTWHIDDSRVLLTGMSDGGTYALLTALFGGIDAVTHYAPIASSFHLRMLDAADADRVRGLRIYLTHGALDWMFPVAMARSAHDALQAAGVAVQFDEIADLSHTYPREQNARLLTWLHDAN